LTIASMTGFARHQAALPEGAGGGALTWEIRSVNGRGLDVRARLPAGWDELDGPVRQAVGKALTRGNVSLTLTVESDRIQAAPAVNHALLDQLAAVAAQTAQRHPDLQPARIDGLLAIRGVLEAGESAPMDPAQATARREAQRAAALDGLEAALADLVAARTAEGARLETVLRGLLDHIDALRARACDLKETQPEALRARFAAQLGTLLDTLGGQPGPQAEDRFYQEAAILATKADVREELDRLATHVAAARELLDDGGVVGRRFDFLCQEFNREANTLCSKAAEPALTTIGLDLKTAIDQVREQVQNIE
jgi:uncharacterized protein (TIGR00255 family)